MSPKKARGARPGTPQNVTTASQQSDSGSVEHAAQLQHDQVHRLRALVKAREAAAIAGVAPSSWWKLDAAGKTPAAIRLGRSTRWSLSELHAWIAKGAPPRDQWEAIKERRK